MRPEMCCDYLWAVMNFATHTRQLSGILSFPLRLWVNRMLSKLWPSPSTHLSLSWLFQWTQPVLKSVVDTQGSTYMDTSVMADFIFQEDMSGCYDRKWGSRVSRALFKGTYQAWCRHEQSEAPGLGVWGFGLAGWLCCLLMVGRTRELAGGPKWPEECGHSEAWNKGSLSTD